jgi:hypothetical protein
MNTGHRKSTVGKFTAGSVLISTMLVACATPSQQLAADRVRAQSGLIGLSKTALLACAGAPWRTGTHEGREYVIYLNGEPRAADVSAPGGMTAPAPALAERPRYCRVTFVVKEGVVEKITLAGYTRVPLVESPECARITDPCLKK